MRAPLPASCLQGFAGMLSERSGDRQLLMLWLTALADLLLLCLAP